MSKILVGHLKHFPTSFSILTSESESGMVTSVPLCCVTLVSGPVSVLIITFPENKKLIHCSLHTVMAKNIITLAILSENAILL